MCFDDLVFRYTGQGLQNINILRETRMQEFLIFQKLDKSLDDVLDRDESVISALT